jgi:hypothetical protein
MGASCNSVFKMSNSSSNSNTKQKNKSGAKHNQKRTEVSEDDLQADLIVQKINPNSLTREALEEIEETIWGVRGMHTDEEIFNAMQEFQETYQEKLARLAREAQEDPESNHKRFEGMSSSKALFEERKREFQKKERSFIQKRLQWEMNVLYSGLRKMYHGQCDKIRAVSKFNPSLTLFAEVLKYQRSGKTDASARATISSLCIDPLRIYQYPKVRACFKTLLTDNQIADVFEQIVRYIHTYKLPLRHYLGNRVKLFIREVDGDWCDASVFQNLEFAKFFDIDLKPNLSYRASLLAPKSFYVKNPHAHTRVTHTKGEPRGHIPMPDPGPDKGKVNQPRTTSNNRSRRARRQLNGSHGEATMDDDLAAHMFNDAMDDGEFTDAEDDLLTDTPQWWWGEYHEDPDANQLHILCNIEKHHHDWTAAHYCYVCNTFRLGDTPTDAPTRRPAECSHIFAVHRDEISARCIHCSIVYKRCEHDHPLEGALIHYGPMSHGFDHSITYYDDPSYGVRVFCRAPTGTNRDRVVCTLRRCWDMTFTINWFHSRKTISDTIFSNPHYVGYFLRIMRKLSECVDYAQRRLAVGRHAPPVSELNGPNGEYTGDDDRSISLFACAIFAYFLYIEYAGCAPCRTVGLCVQYPDTPCIYMNAIIGTVVSRVVPGFFVGFMTLGVTIYLGLSIYRYVAAPDQVRDHYAFRIQCMLLFATLYLCTSGYNAYQAVLLSRGDFFTCRPRYCAVLNGSHGEYTEGDDLSAPAGGSMVYATRAFREYRRRQHARAVNEPRDPSPERPIRPRVQHAPANVQHVNGGAAVRRPDPVVVERLIPEAIPAYLAQRPAPGPYDQHFEQHILPPVANVVPPHGNRPPDAVPNILPDGVPPGGPPVVDAVPVVGQANVENDELNRIDDELYAAPLRNAFVEAICSLVLLGLLPDFFKMVCFYTILYLCTPPSGYAIDNRMLVSDPLDWRWYFKLVYVRETQTSPDIIRFLLKKHGSAAPSDHIRSISHFSIHNDSTLRVDPLNDMQLVDDSIQKFSNLLHKKEFEKRLYSVTVTQEPRNLNASVYR